MYSYLIRLYKRLSAYWGVADVPVEFGEAEAFEGQLEGRSLNHDTPQSPNVSRGLVRPPLSRQRHPKPTHSCLSYEARIKIHRTETSLVFRV